MSMRGHVRRIWRPILLAMLGGLGTTVAIAWVAALSRPGSRPIMGPFHIDSRGQLWMGQRSHGHGWSAATVSGAANWDWYGQEPLPPPPGWMMLSGATNAPDRAQTAVAAGWPFLCLSAHAVGRGDDTPVNGVWRSGLGPQQVHWESWRWAIAWRNASQPGADVPSMKVLPLWPLWPGFVGNVLLWSLLWSIPWLVAATRRVVRRRRGRCAACGYDLRGRDDLGAEAARCPECGVPTSLSVRRSSPGR